MSEDEFIVGQMKLNPLSNEHTPYIEILMDTRRSGSQDQIVLLKVVDTENRPAYRRKLNQPEKAAKSIVEQLKQSPSGFEDEYLKPVEVAADETLFREVADRFDVSPGWLKARLPAFEDSEQEEGESAE